LGGVGTFGVFACVQEVTVTPGELLADAHLVHYTMGASEKDEEEATRKAVDFSTTARRQPVSNLRPHFAASGCTNSSQARNIIWDRGQDQLSPQLALAGGGFPERRQGLPRRLPPVPLRRVCEVVVGLEAFVG
jgi:hypothetical protein